MSNLPIASNNPQPSLNVASAQPNNEAETALSTEHFGAVLERQINGGNTVKKVTPETPKNKDGQQDQDMTVATDAAASDAAGNLLAMLLIPQEIRISTSAEAVQGATTATATPTEDHDSSKLKLIGVEPSIDAKFDKAIASLVSTSGTDTITGKQDNLVQAPDLMDVAILKILPGQRTQHGEISATAIFKTTTQEESLKVTPKLSPSDKPGASIAGFNLFKPLESTGATPSVQNPALNAAMIASGNLPSVHANAPTNGNMQNISSPLGSASWPDEFSQKVNWLSTQQNQVAELHLNPPDLGPLDVVIKVSGNQATALFTSPHLAVREAVENALPRLREMMADAGITLGNATVNDQSLPNRDTGGFFNQGSNAGTSRDAFGGIPETPSPSTESTPPSPPRLHNGIVDIFV